ncbi:translation initiation factor IF-2-like isoform X3 [Myiozetetes cayanensis]|uniref:translation initiation factor IF-2-like isoform X3 n=1 Tax=Myiozetetes cayanensis TaxID=478635 RepID=UPI00215EA72B|nr:translation initiation factor IF-2-like isoform X3 [Myiozetetes cayanensis]
MAPGGSRRTPGPPGAPRAPGAPAPPRQEKPEELRVDGSAEAAGILLHPTVPGQRVQPLPRGADPLPWRGAGPGAGGRRPHSCWRPRPEASPGSGVPQPLAAAPALPAEGAGWHPGPGGSCAGRGGPAVLPAGRAAPCRPAGGDPPAPGHTDRPRGWLRGPRKRRRRKSTLLGIVDEWAWLWPRSGVPLPAWKAWLPIGKDIPTRPLAAGSGGLELPGL